MINTHRGLLYKVCNIYCDDPEDRKDLFQETVLQLWRAFKNFRNEAKPSTWMYRIALNTAISNFRKESKKPKRVALSAFELQIPEMNDAAEKNEKLGMLKQAITKLTQIEKAIILLYLEDKTYEEIAFIMGITKTNVGVKLNRIKSKLETIIKTDNDDFR